MSIVRIIRFDEPEPLVGTQVMRYGKTYQRTRAGWVRLDKAGRPFRRAKVRQWSELFGLDGWSDFVAEVTS